MEGHKGSAGPVSLSSFPPRPLSPQSRDPAAGPARLARRYSRWEGEFLECNGAAGAIAGLFPLRRAPPQRGPSGGSVRRLFPGKGPPSAPRSPQRGGGGGNKRAGVKKAALRKVGAEIQTESKTPSRYSKRKPTGKYPLLPARSAEAAALRRKEPFPQRGPGRCRRKKKFGGGFVFPRVRGGGDAVRGEQRGTEFRWKKITRGLFSTCQVCLNENNTKAQNFRRGMASIHGTNPPPLPLLPRRGIVLFENGGCAPRAPNCSSD